MKTIFYYDESSHNRSITKETLLANDFSELFICSLIGVEISQIPEFNKKYLDFESEFKDRYGIKGELKSTIIKRKKFSLGIKSFRESDVDFLNAYMDILLQFNTKLFISCFNKFSHLVRQIFVNSKFDSKTQNMWTYSITKSISNNHNEKIINSLYTQQNLKEDFKTFLQENIEKNKTNPVKQQENEVFKTIIENIDEFQIKPFDPAWNYLPQFAGFSLYTKELKLNLQNIIIDNEKTTSLAAKTVFGDIVLEKDSIDCIGIRAADILAGFLHKMTQSIFKFTKNKTKVGGVELGILDEQWFVLDESKFNLYKKIKNVLIDLNCCWYKTYCDSNVDEFVMFISLLHYLDSYKNFKEFKSKSSYEHMILFHDYSMKFLEYKINSYFC